MKRVILTLVGLGLALTLATSAEAGGGSCYGRGYNRVYSPAPVYVQPAPATARVEPGYRSFSYQPAARVEPGYRSFSYQPTAAPVIRYQAPTRRMGGGHAYENAINKSLGRVN